ncbi:hypothetical protein HanIR_Chr05g0245051 [Helianthus annuus]|nr:hypothetical protein HanIR_Chr05g0245051 [Helianthus annuus]
MMTTKMDQEIPKHHQDSKLGEWGGCGKGVGELVCLAGTPAPSTKSLRGGCEFGECSPHKGRGGKRRESGV